MVMVLLLSGIMLLHGSARLLEQSMAGIADETAYLRDFYQAQSALQWGLLRQWPSANGWQCQSPATQDWQSCLLWQTPETALLLGMSASGEKVFGGKWSHLKTAARQWWQYLPVGPTFVRCRTRHYAPFRNHGFSLAECLIALLILSLTVLLLSGYHQQLVYGFRMRQAQRDASWAATQVLAGKPPTGWHSELKREMTEDGCLLVTAKVQGPFNRHSELEQWFCPPFDGHLPE